MREDPEPGGPSPAPADVPGSEETLRQSEERFRLLVEGVGDYGIFMLDPAGYIMSWNVGAQRIKGYQPDEIIGKHFSVFYPPEALARGFPQYELEVAEREGRFEDEGWRLRKDGSRFWANVVITALRDHQGHHLGFSKVTRDLTERWRHEDELRQSEERFRLMVESVRDYAIFMLDPGGHVASWNAGAERIKGYAPAEIIGKHFTVFYPPEIVASGFPQHELDRARADGRFEDEGWRLRKDGSRFWANVVITALVDARGELRGYAKVTRDLTQRKRLETLEEEGRETTEFLAMLGHELRNPLAPIRNALEIMRGRKPGDPGAEWARDLIERQVSHLSRLVDDLLEMSRVTSGTIKLQEERLDLGALASEVVESTRTVLEERRHTLSLALPGEPLHVRGDPTRLSQVLANLVGNAAKYTPPGGQLWITLRREDERAVLSVRDNGTGMAPDLVPRVFDLFVQGQRNLDRSEGGLGVGLTLVRKLVHIHGGTAEAFSAGPGQGSEFVVRLPALPRLAAEAALPGKAAPATQGHPSHRVLVVDDNEDSADSMAALLQIWGHDVEVAHDGPSALAMAAERPPEVVLLDIGLPGMSGYEIAPRLRAIPGLADAVIIAMTGYGQAKDLFRSREAGFAVHLVKPVQPEALRGVLADLEASRSR